MRFISTTLNLPSENKKKCGLAVKHFQQKNCLNKPNYFGLDAFIISNFRVKDNLEHSLRCVVTLATSMYELNFLGLAARSSFLAKCVYTRMKNVMDYHIDQR